MATLAKDLVEANGQIEILKASLATLTQERDTAKASVAELSDSLKAEQDAHTATKATLDVEVKAHAEVKAKLDAEIKVHGETKESLAEANRKLADPGYLMASVSGSKTAVAEGGIAETQAALEGTRTRAQLEAEYAKIDGSTIEGARARAEFREKHKDVLGL